MSEYELDCSIDRGPSGTSDPTGSGWDRGYSRELARQLARARALVDALAFLEYERDRMVGGKPDGEPPTRAELFLRTLGPRDDGDEEDRFRLESSQ